MTLEKKFYIQSKHPNNAYWLDVGEGYWQTLQEAMDAKNKLQEQFNVLEYRIVMRVYQEVIL